MASRLRYRRLGRSKGISWNEAIALTRAGNGFFVLDYGVARTLGIAVPAYWWCPTTPREGPALFQQIRETGRLLPPPSGRFLEDLRGELPNSSIIENRHIVSEISGLEKKADPN